MSQSIFTPVAAEPALRLTVSPLVATPRARPVARLRIRPPRRFRRGGRLRSSRA